MRSERMETLWDGEGPVWGGGNGENLSLDVFSFPQWVLVLEAPEEQVYKAKTGIGGYSATGVLV